MPNLYQVLSSLRSDPTSRRKDYELQRAVWEVKKNMYFAREELGGIKTYEKRQRKKTKRKWKLVDSIWAPRRKHAGDFYDTLEATARAFACDWELASARLSLEKKVMRACKSLGEGAAEVEPLETMRRSLAVYADAIYQAFDWYASQGSGNDLFSITRNAYLQFVRDLGLADNDTPGQRDQDLGLIFEAANASARKEDAYNASKALNREEWVGVLVQLVLARCILPYMYIYHVYEVPSC